MQRSSASVRSSTTIDVSQVSVEVEEGEDIDLIGESLQAVNAERQSSKVETLPEAEKSDENRETSKL